jgi:acyl carrier protein phosphodiesterase
MGNFCGDHIKGRLDTDEKKELPVDFIKGVRLHRFIDNFTDTDPIVKSMIKEVAVFYGRAAPIATDICFDYFLAQSFKTFHQMELRVFLDDFYTVVREYSHLIPAPMKPLAEALVENDWLFKYQEWGTVERTFLSMGRRYSFLTDFREIQHGFGNSIDRYRQYFFDFYPRLLAACE